MKTHHETDVEKFLRVALACELMAAKPLICQEDCADVRLPSESPNESSKAVATRSAKAPTPAPFKIRTILVPTDFSPLAAEAIQYAQGMAERLNSLLILLHVTEPVTYVPTHCPVEYVAEIKDLRTTAAQSELDGLIEGLTPLQKEPGLMFRSVVVEGDPSTEIIRVAGEYRADLVVMATHGLKGLKRLMLGSTAEKVVRSAPCPVLVVRDDKKTCEPATKAMSSHTGGVG